MNISMIRYLLGWVFKLEGILMLLPCLIALIYGEPEGRAYLVLGVAAAAAGQLLSKRPKQMEIYQKEGFVTVGLSWILISAYGALPFVITGEIPGYINALFETVSGFTTTGASVLSDVESLSHTSLFWRSFTHWIGGMGVLVFVLTMIPMKAGGSHMNLMKAESPGPEVNKFVPRVKATARLLYKIYIAMTAMQILVLIASRMRWFDAICITFGTAGTGGFGVLNSSCADYTAMQQWIITLFMAAFGVNFGFYYLMLYKRAKDALRMDEVKAYLIILITAAALVALNISHITGDAELTMREATFQVVSIMTTTGFSTTDFNLWPSFSKMIMVLLMFIGACAGSTGGGIKVSRVLIMAKSVRAEFRHLLYPRSVYRIRMNGVVLQDSMLGSVHAYIMGYALLLGISMLLISSDGCSFETTFTAVTATINNIGPGLDAVGPTSNFAGFSVLSKTVLIADMLAGRLELLPMFILFYPGTWKRH